MEVGAPGGPGAEQQQLRGEPGEEPPPFPGHPVAFRPLRGHATAWRPADARVTLHVALDAAVVPSGSSAGGGGARVSTSEIVVLDDFVPEWACAELVQHLTGGADPAPAALPAAAWARRTADAAGGAPTWGASAAALAPIATGALPAAREVHARLSALFAPGADAAWMPSDAIQPPGGGGQAGGAGADCAPLLANAAAAGDDFAWHVDADPSGFPDATPWGAAYGPYFNGEPGRPRLVSALVYLAGGGAGGDSWPREYGADTLFLDGGTDCGVVVRPRRGRCVLLDQDVLHRLTPPGAAARGRLRLSLVWKLALLPRARGGAAPLARPEWGPPTPFGSAARLEAVKRQLRAEMRAEAQARARGAAAGAAG